MSNVKDSKNKTKELVPLRSPDSSKAIASGDKSVTKW